MLRFLSSIQNRHKYLCTSENYNHLYTRYLKNKDKLLNLAAFEKTHKLLDLCGGTGAVTREAVSKGALATQITLVDLNPRCDVAGVRLLKGQAIDVLRDIAAHGEVFDSIVCRQAFAYLEVEGENGDALVRHLATIIRPGGKFVFNLFIRPRFLFKTYRCEGSRYVELAAHLGRRVVHVQMNLMQGYDVTISKWHREERMYELFNQYFDVRIEWSNKAAYWVCTRRASPLCEK